ncbi:branched-chain amino acid ABC transporter permease [Azospirillum sp. A1-3]|uniref:branched-chain amino acid ABC transporter permease n=1 Tax=Azospirillum sp. A1-3 TaxID=185874 RepID=UPI00207728AE|nr:branched-chain amino acid ABC transporter permease [Azospirillum sp. A1-3]MCM8735368.1 branched-chain amino acid ABC transporter permease [Azospirillum sp. A1-3]
MGDILQAAVDGGLQGSVYALVALSFALTFQVLGRVNLAYGAVVMAGSYAGGLAFAAGGGTLGTVAACIAVTGLSGLYVDRLCFSRLEGRWRDVSMVASFAVWMQVEEAVTLVAPGHAFPFPSLSADRMLTVQDHTVRLDSLVVVGGTALAALILRAIVQGSRRGVALRAVVSQPRAAALSGIDHRTMARFAALLGIGLAATAALLIGNLQQQLTPMMGLWVTMKGLAALIVGGGGFLGAAVGAVCLGVWEAVAGVLVGRPMAEAATHLLLLGVVIVAPGRLQSGPAEPR